MGLNNIQLVTFNTQEKAEKCILAIGKRKKVG